MLRSLRPNSRDEKMKDWALGLSLFLINLSHLSGQSIFVDGRGESIMDFTWVIPSAAERLGN